MKLLHQTRGLLRDKLGTAAFLRPVQFGINAGIKWGSRLGWLVIHVVPALMIGHGAGVLLEVGRTGAYLTVILGFVAYVSVQFYDEHRRMKSLRQALVGAGGALDNALAAMIKAAIKDDCQCPGCVRRRGETSPTHVVH